MAEWFLSVKTEVLEWLLDVKDKAVAAFITQDRWKLYLEGFGVTLQVAFFCSDYRYYYRYHCGTDETVQNTQGKKDNLCPHCGYLYRYHQRNTVCITAFDYVVRYHVHNQ